jgi:hypothetical protein
MIPLMVIFKILCTGEILRRSARLRAVRGPLDKFLQGCSGVPTRLLARIASRNEKHVNPCLGLL